ncbi:hypothetical protein [Streptomyces sp. G-5]|uniref:hypothetical protein n=1 Tax=Streptomyces sp. G-5 TaxID=2977231 RepID=UPI0021CEDB75|nr:hypothetical protein [Streptomyces sp. G-5]MCU4750264.1 hypothetical protein [Streptomyces sp. G-5]
MRTRAATDGEAVPEAVEARPWRPEDGPEPQVWVWPYGTEPALWVGVGGQWRRATVRARQDHADGRTVYQTLVDLDGSSEVLTRSYQWPQAGLRLAHRGSAPPIR